MLVEKIVNNNKFVLPLNGNGFDIYQTFYSTNLPNECWVRLNRSATLSKALKEVESLSNGSCMKYELDQTFSRLPYYYVSKPFELFARLLFTFCPIFVRHLLKGLKVKCFTVKGCDSSGFPKDAGQCPS